MGRKLSENCGNIAAGIEKNDDDLKHEAFRELRWQFYPRLLFWGVVGVLYILVGHGTMADYLCWVALIYIAAIIIAACTTAPEAPNQEVVTPLSDELALKHAKQGRDVLLDMILVVGESLERMITGTYTIACPTTKGQLAYPHINRCIQVSNGVASTMVAFPFAGEMDKRQFAERFNARMCQMLNAGELPYRQEPIFTGKDNIPRTAIQAIHSDIVGDRIILEVIRVTEEAIPLLNALEHESMNPTTDRDTLYDDDL